MDLPRVDGGFGCILADPPWSFLTYGNKRTTPHRGAQEHYGVTDTADLAKLAVGDVAAKDCALFMWVVDSHLPDALTLATSWGFNFKTCAFVWVKSREGGYAKIGMGYWTRKQTEQCWLFTRGSPRRLGKGVRQIIHCPRGAHSAKPDVQYEHIETLVGGPYLELFARSRRPGWSAFGNEVGARDGLLFAEAAE